MDDEKKPDGVEFSESVRQQLEDIAKERDHRRWLVDAVKRVVLYLAATIVGLGVVWDAIAKLIRLVAESVRS